MTTTPREFCESIEFDIPISWFDRLGVHVIDDDRRAEIELKYGRVAGYYNSFRVTIRSKTAGSITFHNFAFDEHLPREDRLDDHPDYPGPGRQTECFVVIDHCGWKWYIARPETTRPLAEAIEAFVELYR